MNWENQYTKIPYKGKRMNGTQHDLFDPEGTPTIAQLVERMSQGMIVPITHQEYGMDNDDSEPHPLVRQDMDITDKIDYVKTAGKIVNSKIVEKSSLTNEKNQKVELPVEKKIVPQNENKPENV